LLANHFNVFLHIHTFYVQQLIILIEHLYLQQLEVVPLFGDMQICPFNYIKRSPHYDAGKWPNCNSSTPSGQCSLLEQLQGMREEHVRYISELARHSNEVTTTQRDNPRSDAENKELHDLALRGLQNLSTWTLQVIELVSRQLQM
jgi:cytoplasmic FMR1 interacting protein